MTSITSDEEYGPVPCFSRREAKKAVTLSKRKKKLCKFPYVITIGPVKRKCHDLSDIQYLSNNTSIVIYLVFSIYLIIHIPEVCNSKHFTGKTTTLHNQILSIFPNVQTKAVRNYLIDIDICMVEILSFDWLSLATKIL